MIKHPHLLLVPFSLVLTACGGSGILNGTGGAHPTVRTVYTMTNQTSGNSIAAFDLINGSLTEFATYSTGGTGTGTGDTPAAPMGGNDPLGSQSSLTISPNQQFLFAVNAGSGTVSSFRIASDGSLTLVSTVNTGGNYPISVAATNSLVYVANLNNPTASGPGTLFGFTLASDGTLTPISSSSHVLAAVNSRITAIAFSSDGQSLLSTERTSELVASYPVQSDGTLGTPKTSAETGLAPFGLTVNGSVAFVANAGNDSGSTYQTAAKALTPVSASVTNGNKATCWAAFSPDGKHVYTANAGSNNVTTYQIQSNGTATIQQSGVATGGSADGPLDGAVTADGKYYVQLLGASGKVAVFNIDSSGNLTLGTSTSPILPAPGAQGLAIR